MIEQLNKDELAARFYRMHTRGPGCWEWIYSKDECGYGQIMLTAIARGIRKLAKAHRVSWELYRGAIPDGMQILHKCDNPACVNPDHLFLGTRSDNMRDMYSKGRKTKFGPSGDKHPKAVLNAKMVLEMRRRKQAGEKVASIARSVGVKYGTVWAAVNGENWHANQ